MIYRINEFVPERINPITNQPYDDSWIAYCLTDSKEYQMMVGKQNESVYTANVSRYYDDWMMSVCDFIDFNEARKKNIILSVEEEYLYEANINYAGHKYNDAFLREKEPDVLIHSTTYDNWLKIKEDGCLKCWNLLEKENALEEDWSIGYKLGDPVDFSNFIMFSGGHVSSEIVVMSKQNGKIIMDSNAKYKTGVRLYFDAKKIAEDGLLVRDGMHLKVENSLLLEPYLLWYATWDRVGLESEISTPSEYTEKANKMFNSLFEGKVKTIF